LSNSSGPPGRTRRLLLCSTARLTAGKTGVVEFAPPAAWVGVGDVGGVQLCGKVGGVPAVFFCVPPAAWVGVGDVGGVPLCGKVGSVPAVPPGISSNSVLISSVEGVPAPASSSSEK